MNIKNTLLLIGTVVLFSSCADVNNLKFGNIRLMDVKPANNKAISSTKLIDRSDIDLLNEEDEDEEKELYFIDTKDKIIYLGVNSASDIIGYQSELLLNKLFTESKNNLPKISRKKKINISIEISKYSENKEKILYAAQNYILANKRFALSNTDEHSLQILQKVLKSESDGIYNNNTKIETINASDIILFIGSDKVDKNLKIKAKILSKNGSRLGQTQKLINLEKNTDKQWIEVKVPRQNNTTALFEIMRNPVTNSQYTGTGNKSSLTGLSQASAEKFCMSKMNAKLVTPYVFEHARRSYAMARPTSIASIEIIAAFDEDDDDIFYQDGDVIEGEDSSIITFQWTSEKYFEVSNLFKSPSATFRCMKSK